MNNCIIIILIAVHMIGFIIATILHERCGTYEDAIKRGNGINHAEPADVFFQDLLIWEINLVLFILENIRLLINYFFYYVLYDKMKDGDD